MFEADSIHLPDSLKYKTLINERTVFGGGGIMPDYYVPIDTTSGTMFHATLNARGVVNRTAISEVDNNRNSLLNKHPNVVSFMSDYKVDDTLEDKLRSIASEVEVDWNDDEYIESKDLIFVQLKALIARDLYDSSAFFRIINEENDIYLEGLKIILDDEKYLELLKGDNDKY